jgi:uncharacterized protein YecE (DUF72 family)
MKSKHFFIGCSGYYYSSWKNVFYPKGLAPSKWLEHYSSIFNSVELNGTFYRVPFLSTLQKYYEQVPENFRFSVKASKYITHILRLKNSSEKVKEFSDLMFSGLGNKLENILFQLPPSFHYNDENIEAYSPGKNACDRVSAHFLVGKQN